MSSTLPIIPIRWRRPDENTLYENVYKHGTPNFHPFPTVTDVVCAAHCPLAILHSLLHGQREPLTETRAQHLRLGYKIGNIFHDFIAHLKTRALLDNIRFTDMSQIRREFEDFTRYRGINDRAKRNVWEYYLRPWCERKLDELGNLISSSSRIFFEVQVGNAYVSFRTPSGGSVSYPLLGRIDEVDIDNRKIIERTSMGLPNETDPPRLKDFQIWLLWKTLIGIPRSRLPSFFRGINFRNFELVVETPYRDFYVDKDDYRYETLTHQAYTWIHDVFFERRVYHEAYLNRSCTYSNQIENCGFRLACYGRRGRRPYREARDEMRREFRAFYLHLAYELLWSQHLFRYQLTMLSEDELENLGRIALGRVISYQNDRIEIRLERTGMNNLLSKRESGEIGGYSIVVGTPLCGVKIFGYPESFYQDRVVLRLRQDFITPSETATLLVTDPEAVAFTEEPWFLVENIQRNLFSLETWGKIKDDTAENDPTVRFIEALFGTRRVRPEGGGGSTHDTNR